MSDFKHEVYDLTKRISKSKLKNEYDEIIPAFYIDGGSKSVYNQMTIARGHQFLSFFITLVSSLFVSDSYVCLAPLFLYLELLVDENIIAIKNPNARRT